MCHNFINITVGWFVEGLIQGESIVCALQWLLLVDEMDINLELQAQPLGVGSEARDNGNSEEGRGLGGEA